MCWRPPALDRHSAYVALSRHRDDVEFHYGRDDFADQGRLVRTLLRERAKDMASDYVRDFADRRAIVLPLTAQLASERTIEPAPPRQRGMFEGLKLRVAPIPTLEQGTPSPLTFAVQRYARATADILKLQGQGIDALPHQRVALDSAGAALNAVRHDGARDLRGAFARDHGLIDDAANGRTTATLRAMMLENEVRNDPSLRADRFVEEWRKLRSQHEALNRVGDNAGLPACPEPHGRDGEGLRTRCPGRVATEKRLPELGMRAVSKASLSHDLQEQLGLSRSRGMGR